MKFEVPDGATPIYDSSDLLIPWVHTMSDLNRIEAENISFAQKKYLKTAPLEIANWFNFPELCAIHCAMFGKVWSWAGKQRKSITSIGVPPKLISLQMAELCTEVASWSTHPVELTFLEKGAKIHHRLVKIHPFENGNGRFSRLVADRCLLGWKCSHPIWPENLQSTGTSRKKYIKTLQAADAGDYEPLIGFMKDLGANEPSLSTLFRDSFYKPYLDGSSGLAIIKALLRRGVDPNQRSQNGHPPLHLLLKTKSNLQRKMEILELLINKGALINILDKNGHTPFQESVARGNKELAIFLKSMGADPLAPKGTGYSKYYEMFLQFPPN